MIPLLWGEGEVFPVDFHGQIHLLAFAVKTV
jgi:hypothetical protein